MADKLPSRKSANIGGNQSIHRSFDILEMLVDRGKPITIKEIAVELEMSISAVHSLLKAMVARGYVAHLAPRQGYIPGPSLSNLSMKLSREQQLLALVKPVVDQLNRDCDDETSYLGYFQDLSVQHLYTKISSRLLSVGRTQINRQKLHMASMGKVLLAHLSPKEYAAWRADTPRLTRGTVHSITDFERLVKELAGIRESGYAINDQESEEGAYTIAVPIFNHVGRAVASIAIGMPVIRFSEEKKERYIRQLRQHSVAVSSSLGFADNEHR